MKTLKVQEKSQLKERAEGQVIILFALMLFVLVGFLALSVDVGYLMSERRDAQAAADAGVLAAAVASVNGETITDVRDAGFDYALQNVANDNSVIEIHNPPTSGEFAGDDEYIQVVVTKDVPKFFVGALYTGDWSVQASAVAGLAPQEANAALLALNSDSGGIETGGSTYIEVINGSIVSNYNIDTSGSTHIESDEWIWANDGFDESGSSTLMGGMGENPNAPEVPDPLAERLSSPSLPVFPASSPPAISPSANGDCDTYSNATWMSPPVHSLSSSRFSGGGGGCVSVENIGEGPFTFNGGDYHFRNNAGLSIAGGNSDPIVLESGRYHFDGGNGISVGGNTPQFDMEAGEYWFTDGAEVKINGSAPNNRLGIGSSGPSDSLFYFTGGGGIDPGGSNKVTLYPGTYIFDGGPGIDFAGSSELIFEPGDYEFHFRNGAGFRFSGSSRISYNGSVWAQMYFTGDSNVVHNCNKNKTQLCMGGSTAMNIPSGEYYFDRALMANHGSTTITGENVFLYFTNGSYLHSSGSARFGFTAPDWEIYPGYFPGVFMYSERGNTAEFQWNGSSSSESEGIIYLPNSKLTMGGSSRSKVFTGQIIADSFDFGGSNETVVEFYEYVENEVPTVYLVE